MYFNKKYCKGTIKNPPPTPKSPDANPAQIPIKIKPMKYSIGNIISLKIFHTSDKYYLPFQKEVNYNYRVQQIFKHNSWRKINGKK